MRGVGTAISEQRPTSPRDACNEGLGWGGVGGGDEDWDGVGWSFNEKGS